MVAREPSVDSGGFFAAQIFMKGGLCYDVGNHGRTVGKGKQADSAPMLQL